MGRKKTEYFNGQILGDYNVTFIKDIESTTKERKAEFICPYCNKIFIASIYKVKSNHTKSCGCLQKEKAKQVGHAKKQDLTNKRFDHLLVLKEAESRINESGRVRNYWLCKCDCGSIIEVETSNLTTGHTRSCGCIKSRGEEKIAKILIENNIKYEKEKILPNLNFFRFDFYIPDLNYCIEYDGIQHFTDEKGLWGTENLKIIQQRDIIKNQFCKENNIPLIRIPYTYLDKISIKDLLLETSQFLI